jgi:hypothetical protein
METSDEELEAGSRMQQDGLSRILFLEKQWAVSG